MIHLLTWLGLLVNRLYLSPETFKQVYRYDILKRRLSSTHTRSSKGKISGFLWHPEASCWLAGICGFEKTGNLIVEEEESHIYQHRLWERTLWNIALYNFRKTRKWSILRGLLWNCLKIWFQNRFEFFRFFWVELICVLAAVMWFEPVTITPKQRELDYRVICNDGIAD